MIVRALVATFSVFLWSQLVSGQASCVTADEVKAMLTQVNSSQNAAFDQDLQKELLKLKSNAVRRVENAVAGYEKDDTLRKQIRQDREDNTAQLCRILKKYGWPSMAQVSKDGIDAMFFLLRNSSSFELQKDLLPVIVAATKKNDLGKQQFASYFDRLRVRAGLKQLFGSEARIANGFIVLYPIEAEAQVDARRKQYEMPPLADYLRALQAIYQLPLIKSPVAPTRTFSESLSQFIAGTKPSSLVDEKTIDQEDVVRINTNLVSLNVSVYGSNSKAQVNVLQQEDFKVVEDGHEETVTFFATTDVPFDLVLLLDLSDSTAGKRNLIRETTLGFIEAARPSDRIAIVTFADTTNVISPLTDDHARLSQSLGKIDGSGGTRAWDALKFSLDEVLGRKALDNRRKAVIFMTDGEDNALMFRLRVGSTISFADLVESVRRSDTLVVPIFLDTRSEGLSSNRLYIDRIRENARRTLQLLADESGGLFYTAKSIRDLRGVYGQVINDLGKVYSLGYKPTNEKRDGSWRTVQIQLPNHPDLTTRARPGYYAN